MVCASSIPRRALETEDAEFGDDGRLTNEDRAIGELVQIDPGQSFEGYYRNPEADRLRFRDGIFWSGDLAYRDARRVDLLRRAGQ